MILLLKMKVKLYTHSTWCFEIEVWHLPHSYLPWATVKCQSIQWLWFDTQEHTMRTKVSTSISLCQFLSHTYMTSLLSFCARHFCFWHLQDNVTQTHLHWRDWGEGCWERGCCFSEASDWSDDLTTGWTEPLASAGPVWNPNREIIIRHQTYFSLFSFNIVAVALQCKT